MKFIDQEIAGKGNRRYMFALGKYEALILIALLEKALHYMPRTFITQTTEYRMSNMLRAMKEAVPKMVTSTMDNDLPILP